MKLIVASNNKGKIKEYKEILEPIGFEVISQKEAGIVIEAEENGSSFEENSMIKAEAIFDLTDCAVLADDSGLTVDALNGEPGIYSARYEGIETSEGRSQRILDKMKDVPDRDRGAHFVCAIYLILNDGTVIRASGRCDGKIGYGFKGKNGFGYDPIFMFGDKSFAELTSEEKNSVSHRAMALKDLINKLKGYNL